MNTDDPFGAVNLHIKVPKKVGHVKKDMDSIETCKLCALDYEAHLRPRVLPCGHTYCTDCLVRLIKSQTLKCPRCQKVHIVTSTRDLSINYDLEEMISEGKKTSSTAPPELKFTVYNQSHRNTKMDKIIAEQKYNMDKYIKTSYSIEFQLDEYHKFLLDKKKNHQDVLQKIQDLTNRHENIVESINNECAKIANAKKESKDFQKEVKDKLSNLDNAQFSQAAGAALADVIDMSSKVEGWLELCSKMFPDVKIALSEELLQKSLEWITLGLSAKDEDVQNTIDLPDDLTIMAKVIELGTNPIITRITDDFMVDVTTAEGKKLNNLSLKAAIQFTSQNHTVRGIDIIELFKNPAISKPLTDGLNQLLNRCRMTQCYTGMLTPTINPNVVFKDIKELNVLVPNTESYKPLNTLMQEKLHLLNFLNVSVQQNVSLDVLEPLSGVKFTSLFLPYLKEEQVKYASSMAKRLNPTSDKKCFFRLFFPRCDLSPEGVKSLLRELEGVGILSGLHFPSSLRPSNKKELKELQEIGRRMIKPLQDGIIWGTGGFTQGSIYDVDSW